MHTSVKMLKIWHIFAILVVLFFIIRLPSISGNENLFETDQKNVYYIESEQKFSWFDALTRCASMNMSLATIDTSIKSDDLTSLLKRTFGKKIPLWIGGCVNGANPRQFVWSTTGKKFVYTNWADGQPDFAGNNEYCAQTGFNKDMEWNDVDCKHSFGFICEYNPLHKCKNEIMTVGKLPEKGPAESSQVMNCTNGRTFFRDIVVNIHPN